MKKLFLILTILGAFLLSSCSTSLSNKVASTDSSTNKTDITYTNSSSNVQTSPSTVTTPKSGNDSITPDVTPSSLPSDKQVLSPMQTFKTVLLNEITFLCTDKVPYNTIVHQWNGYLNEVTFDNNPMITPQFAIIDLDGDGVSEIVLAIEDYNGFVILRYKEGKVYGNIVSYRTMYCLKKDGSFVSSNGANDNSMGKMLFVGDTIFCNDKLRSSGGPITNSYYIHDMPIDKDTWHKCMVSFDDLSDVEWYDYSKESVNKWLLDSSVSLKMPQLSKKVTANRQDYLDSLSYLMDLRNRSLENQEETNSNAQSYYDSCNNEMNKINQLCSKKLSSDELESLSTEQQRWQENFNQSFSEVLSNYLVTSMDDLADQSWYYVFGDMMLKRTFNLLNIYYDQHFYD